MAYHLASIPPLLMTNSRKDILEMSLHHLICIFMYFGAYMLNTLECSGSFGYFHDLSEPPLMLVKVLAETNCSTLTGLTFAFNMVTWFWTRMFAMVIIIYQTAVYCPVNSELPNFFIYSFVVLMVMLCF